MPGVWSTSGVRRSSNESQRFSKENIASFFTEVEAPSFLQKRKMVFLFKKKVK